MVPGQELESCCLPFGELRKRETEIESQRSLKNQLDLRKMATFRRSTIRQRTLLSLSIRTRQQQVLRMPGRHYVRVFVCTLEQILWYKLRFGNADWFTSGVTPTKNHANFILHHNDSQKVGIGLCLMMIVQSASLADPSE